MAKGFVIWMLWGAWAAAQTVEGTVVNSVTGGGIAGIQVEILEARKQGGKADYSATTDAQGHFRIEAVSDGVYRARYISRHYWPGPDEEAQRFSVIAGRDPVKMEAHLIPLCRISGRVVDAKGKGVPNAQVELADPWPSVSETDAEGRFQLEDLPPGVDALSVRPPPGWEPPDPESGSDQVLAWTRTFYPGVARPDAASDIVLAPGAVVTDVELKLLAAPAHAIRGVLLNADGTPAAKVTIHLAEDPPPLPPAYTVKSRPDGTFEFPAVVDGEWRLQAEVGAGEVGLQAIQWIEMAGHEWDGVKLRLSPPFEVRGRVIMEASKGTQAPKPPPVGLDPHVSRWRRESFGRMPASLLGPPARVQADGSFSIENVYPGAYRIVPNDPLPPYYLDSVKIGETEPTAPEVEFSGPVSITLVYKSNGGSVRGTVEGCAAGMVLLVPQDPAIRRPGFFRQVRCDSNNRYEISAVRPGEYYALATVGNGATGWGLFTPEAADARAAIFRANAGMFESGLLNQAASVTVRAGEASVADLLAITRLAY